MDKNRISYGKAPVTNKELPSDADFFFLGDFDAIVRDHPAIAWRKFNLNGGSSVLRRGPAPFGAVEKKLLLDGEWMTFEPSESLLTYRPGPVRDAVR